jgi:16S rRNA (guanine(966)-N(2))-methyltransferase RsmD
MRVTGGEYSGRRIEVPPGEIRPAMDRMRESLFSILTSAMGGLEGTAVLDLFSGSGSMALEALSRGAAGAVLVERDRGKARTIRKNLAHVDTERWRLVTVSAEQYLRRASGAAGPPFDLIFADPPFKYPDKRKLLSRIAEAGIMKSTARLVIHFPKEDELADDVQGLELTDRRAYGRSIVHIYLPVATSS